MNEYITKEEYDVLESRLIEIIKMLHGCIKNWNLSKAMS
jgi:hypothetical protein